MLLAPPRILSPVAMGAAMKGPEGLSSDVPGSALPPLAQVGDRELASYKGKTIVILPAAPDGPFPSELRNGLD
jgi:hypothetical protein